jgi:hypothetical protein
VTFVRGRRLTEGGGRADRRPASPGIVEVEVPSRREVVMSVRYRQNPAVEAASLQDETILLNPDTNQFCILNHTASAIWSRIGKPATSAEIAADISAQFADVTEGDALRDVEEALRQLTERQLVTRE